MRHPLRSPLLALCLALVAPGLSGMVPGGRAPSGSKAIRPHAAPLSRETQACLDCHREEAMPAIAR